MKRVLYFLLVFNLLLVHAQVATVEAIGFGMTEGQAKNDALRNAVEQGAGVKIFSQTEVQNFVALKDVLVSETIGLVTSYQVLSSVNKGKNQGWEVKVKAEVSKEVSSQWAKMKIILQQKGNPSVMFCIKESLDAQELPQPTGEYQLMNKFKNLGFKIVDRQYVQEAKELQKQLYTLDQNPEGIIAIASKQGADLLVVGFLEGAFVQYMQMYGDIQQIIHNYIFRTKIIRTDTGEVIGSITEKYNTNRSSMLFSRETAGRAGFADIIGEKYIQPMMVDMLKVWIKDVQEGAEMELIISNVEFRMRKKILETLENLPDLITWVRVNHYRNKRLELRIKSKLNSEELAEKMEQIPGLRLEVAELQKNRLELNYVGQ